MAHGPWAKGYATISHPLRWRGLKVALAPPTPLFDDGSIEMLKVNEYRLGAWMLVRSGFIRLNRKRSR